MCEKIVIIIELGVFDINEIINCYIYFLEYLFFFFFLCRLELFEGVLVEFFFEFFFGWFFRNMLVFLFNLVYVVKRFFNFVLL